MLICLYFKEYFELTGETSKIPLKLSIFKKFKLIVDFIRKLDGMSTDLFIFRDGLAIFKHYKQSYSIYFTVTF